MGKFKKIIAPEKVVIYFILFYSIFFFDVFSFLRKLKIFCALHEGETAGEGNIRERVDP